MFITRNIGAARSAGDDFWYSPVSAATASGVRVSEDSALRLSTVYKCVRVRAETIGSLPLMLYRTRQDGGRDLAREHPLFALLHDAPNPWMTSMQWRQTLQAQLDLRGNAYSEIVYNGAGRIDMLLPMHPDHVRVELVDGLRPRYRYSDPTTGRERVLVFGEVLHVPGLTLDGSGYVGMNPIELQREAIAAGIASRDYGSRYFANSARPPLWVEFDGKFPSPEERRQWATAFSAAHAGFNAGRIPVMERGMKLNALQISNADAQFLEQRKYSDLDIAALFRVPPHKIGLLDRATWGNIEHQQIDFVTDTILPSCVAWEKALRRDLGIEPEVVAEFKLEGLQRGDTKTRYEAYSKAITDGWMTRNEARRLENLNPLEGLDEPLQPLNMTAAGEEPETSSEPEPRRGEQDSPAGQRLAAVLFSCSQRIARKEARALEQALRPQDDPETAVREVFGASHARFVAEVLAVSDDVAAAYCHDTADRAVRLLADGTLRSMTPDDWIDAQTHRLLRLEA